MKSNINIIIYFANRIIICIRLAIAKRNERAKTAAQKGKPAPSRRVGRKKVHKENVLFSLCSIFLWSSLPLVHFFNIRFLLYPCNAFTHTIHILCSLSISVLWHFGFFFQRTFFSALFSLDYNDYPCDCYYISHSCTKRTARERIKKPGHKNRPELLYSLQMKCKWHNKTQHRIMCILRAKWISQIVRICSFLTWWLCWWVELRSNYADPWTEREGAHDCGTHRPKTKWYRVLSVLLNYRQTDCKYGSGSQYSFGISQNGSKMSKIKPQNEDVCDTDTKPMWEASLQGNTISFK